MKSFNEKAVNGLYHSSRQARTILNEIAGMPKQSETLLETLEQRLGERDDLTRRDIVSLFKHLEEYGAGEFIPGRRGHPSRFKWSVDSITLSTVDVTFPRTDEPAKQGGRQESYAVAPLPAYQQLPPESHAHSVLINHQFQLRPNLSINVTLPSDMTPTEALRLSQFIQSLPFVPESFSVHGYDRIAGAH